jgi:alkanesulfonate monooxygenase SsuD/methylene tetrahydromethanopterin reductase-like flavin-dependent oxidoreductase (luciferase family)
VVKLPLRNPVLVAKQVSSIAVLAENRLCLGVGLSPWLEDYEAVEVPWERRGQRLDEMIDIIRGLCAGDYFHYEGEIFRVPSIKLCPVPSARVPIVVGGHSDPALRRAARLGDGWIHAGGDPAELARMLARLSELRAEYGRENEPFEVHVFHPDGYDADGIKRLEDLGITDLLVGFRNSYTVEQDSQSLDEKIAAIHQYADAVIAKTR